MPTVPTAVARARARMSLRRCDHVGRDSLVTGRVVVENLGRITIGDGLRLVSQPVVTHLVTGPNGSLEIGRGVRIGYGGAIACHSSVTIGDFASIGPFVMIMDTDFHEVANRELASASKAVTIGARARIGSRVTILRGATIGDGAEVLAGSVVSGDVAPGSRVGGVPARPLHTNDRRSALPTMDDVRLVLMQTFGLDVPPDDSAMPESVAGWDSLGALNLLLSLEEAFGVELRPEELFSVRELGDLVRIVHGAAQRS